ncbi:thiamine pyrophosphate-dependent enzyme [Amycolatopsis sp. GM8]|uniref:thiamine pyrophosphate-dependent enzyme n=1 Tax=Amycolatopsis sp. GM8 TaxID=2896530 RepID=UPI001F029934|nr:thiamine pyrophosphate-dependent enzyme [Amycolatopsis sp. GM8]
MEAIDAHFVRRAGELCSGDTPLVLAPHQGRELLAYFDAQALSRHTDFAARQLQPAGQAFYTISSAGHESNAAVALALRPTDPALLHYRSGGFYAARASQVPGVSAADDILRGAMSSTADGISGGRHKVFGSVALNVIPQTSTIASHLPRAFGVALAMDKPARRDFESAWPADSIVVCSFGDASANHSTALGALNATAYCAHRRLPLPLLFVCEDNGIGISTRSPAGWVENLLRSFPGVDYYHARGTAPIELMRTAGDAAAYVRQERRPAILHLETVRFMGHAGSDAEIAYRSVRDIEGEYARDPLLATAQALLDARVLTIPEIIERYETARATVAASADRVPREYLRGAEEVVAPIVHRDPVAVARHAARSSEVRSRGFRDKMPEDGGPLTLAQSINAALKDVMAAYPQSLVFGEDVGRKGGVYGVTRGLLKAFGPDRVFDTVLDEQTILGTALGASLAGFLPIPEIQYLAYLHNAEDQLRGEGATLRFFSDGQYENGMVVRVAGLAYQRGFGGHFHNDNSLAVLRDIPGLIVAVPSHPSSAPGLLRQCAGLAMAEGRVCVFVEPIALYHQRDLHDGDAAWTASYAPPMQWPADSSSELGHVRTVRDGGDLLILTFGNGVRMSLLAAERLARSGIETTIVDLQWLSPLPVGEIVRIATRHPKVLVVDETRKSGGVAESVVATLIDEGYEGRVGRVNSVDSFVPLGPSAQHVLLSENDIVRAATELGEK